jgi:hypothetical protein
MYEKLMVAPREIGHVGLGRRSFLWNVQTERGRKVPNDPAETAVIMKR